PAELILPNQDIFEVLSPSGRVLGQSQGLSTASQVALRSASRAGYFNLKVNQQDYRGLRLDGVRIIDRDDKGGLRRPVTIFYAGPTRNIWHEALEAVRFYLIAGALLLTGTGFALIWFLRRRLSPLQ